MFCLLNTNSYKAFVYHPNRKEFLAVGKQVFSWHVGALDCTVVRLSSLNDINAYRKVFNTLSYTQLEKMTGDDAIEYMHKYHPELLV